MAVLAWDRLMETCIKRKGHIILTPGHCPTR